MTISLLPSVALSSNSQIIESMNSLTFCICFEVVIEIFHELCYLFEYLYSYMACYIIDNIGISGKCATCTIFDFWAKLCNNVQLNCATS